MVIINSKRYSILIWVALIIALVWEAYVFSIFHSLNGFAYDQLTRMHVKASTSEQLLVLDGDQHYAKQGDEVWLPLLKNVLKLNVRQVVFNFMPEKVSSDFYQFAAKSGRVVFSQHVDNSDPYSPAQLRPLPLAAQNKNIPLGVISPPSSQGGIYRTQNLSVDVEGESLPTLEFTVAQRVLGEPIVLKSPDYLINFIGGSAKIPKINLAQALSGHLIGELVSGRTLLIGVYGIEPLANYFTPLSTTTGPDSDVLYHAFALDTLLAQRAIRITSNWAMLLGIVAITSVTLIFCQYLIFQHALLVSTVLTLGCFLLSWLGLHGWTRWIPPVELISAQWLTIILFWHYRVVQENQLLDIALFKLSTNLQDKAFPTSFFQSEDPWEPLIVMINQSLNLQRMIFLERVPNDHRLQEIKAFNCSINDVVEARRDYERTPYSTVIQENRPLVLEKPYLKQLAGNDHQYLAPLIFAGEILGFWAFTTEPNTKIESKTKFLSLTKAYMIQISEILYYRQEWQKRQEQGSHKILTYFNVHSATNPYQTLNRSVALLDSRTHELQQVFNSMNTGGVLYDLFGRVLLLNKYMEELAQSANLKLFNMSALDLIIAVTGFDTTTARQILQKTIFDLEVSSIPVANFKAGRDYILHLQPLKSQEHQNQSTNAAPVFQIVGVLCELEDVTELKAIFRLKEKLFERFSFQLRNNLESIQLALPACEGGDLSTEEKTSALANIHGKIEAISATLASVSEQMSIEVESLVSDLGCYPIDGIPAIKNAVIELNEYAALRSIKLNLESPNLLGLVFASPNELYQLFDTVLTVLIDDTFEGADVWVTLEEKEEWVHYHFRNSGLGITRTKPQPQNENGELMLFDEFKMDKVFEYAQYWGGQFEMTNQMGIGSTATLSLKRFL